MFHVDLTSLRPATRRDYWQELMPTHAIQPMSEAGPAQPATITSWNLGQIALGPARVNEMRLSRTAADVRRDQLDHYAIAVTRGGRWRGVADGRAFEAGPGSVFLLDMARPVTLEATDMDTVQVVAPRELIDAVAPAEHLHGALLRGAAAGLLHDHINALVQRLPDLEQGQAPGVARATLAMIGVALQPGGGDPAAEPIASALLLARARKLIESRLEDPALSPDDVCAALQVSRTRLYALFERFDGVSAYIRRRRLMRVRAILARGGDGRQIFAIARTFGFTDPAHFSRAFRDLFGVSPREARQQGYAASAADAKPAPAEAETLTSWLHALSADID